MTSQLSKVKQQLSLSESKKDGTKDGCKCYKCGSPDHLANSPACPKFKPKTDGKNDGGSSSGGGNGSANGKWKLPARLMVLSAVMQSAWAKAMWPSLPTVPSPVTFVEAAASVRGLLHPLVPHHLPPDKSRPSALLSILKSLAMEREKHYNWMFNCLLPVDDSPAPTTSLMPCPSNVCDFKITTGCSSYTLYALHR